MKKHDSSSQAELSRRLTEMKKAREVSFPGLGWSVFGVRALEMMRRGQTSGHAGSLPSRATTTTGLDQARNHEQVYNKYADGPENVNPCVTGEWVSLKSCDQLNRLCRPICRRALAAICPGGARNLERLIGSTGRVSVARRNASNWSQQPGKPGFQNDGTGR
jgi:hypothetical protein